MRSHYQRSVQTCVEAHVNVKCELTGSDVCLDYGNADISQLPGAYPEGTSISPVFFSAAIAVTLIRSSNIVFLCKCAINTRMVCHYMFTVTTLKGSSEFHGCVYVQGGHCVYP